MVLIEGIYYLQLLLYLLLQLITVVELEKKNKGEH